MLEQASPTSNITDRPEQATAASLANTGPAPGTGSIGVPPPVRFPILRIALFLTILGTAIAGVDWIIDTGLRRLPTGDFGVTNRVMGGMVNAEIVISGSSRALTHYDSRIIEAATNLRTFNIGLNGSQTDMQLAYLRAYLKHNRKPRLIIHNLDLFAFVTSHEIYNPAQYVPYLHEPSIYAGVSRSYPDAWKWRYLPLYGYVVPDMRFTWLLGVRSFLGLPFPETRYQGFLPRYTPWTGDFDSYRASHPEGVTFEVERQGLLDFKDLLRLCRDEGIPVLLVYSPEYIEMQEMERNRGEIFRLFEEISSSFGAALWDYSDSPISKDKQYFYNSQHLNAHGARTFSAAVADRLKQHPVVAGSPTP